MRNKTNHLVDRLKKGDECAFDEFYDVHYSRMVRYASHYLYNLSESEDLVQGLFLYVWENISEIDPKGTLEAYLYTALKNRCLNRLKSLNLEDKYNLLYVEASLRSELQNGTDLNELSEKLSQAIEKLPDQIKKIIRLKYFENKKVTEISEFLNVSVNTVKTQLQRGRAKLRVELGSDADLMLFLLLTSFN